MYKELSRMDNEELQEYFGKEIASLKSEIGLLGRALLRACRERKSIGSDYTVLELYNQYYSTEKRLSE